MINFWLITKESFSQKFHKILILLKTWAISHCYCCIAPGNIVSQKHPTKSAQLASLPAAPGWLTCAWIRLTTSISRNTQHKRKRPYNLWQSLKRLLLTPDGLLYNHNSFLHCMWATCSSRSAVVHDSLLLIVKATGLDTGPGHMAHHSEAAP